MANKRTVRRPYLGSVPNAQGSKFAAFFQSNAFAMLLGVSIVCGGAVAMSLYMKNSRDKAEQAPASISQMSKLTKCAKARAEERLQRGQMLSVADVKEIEALCLQPASSSEEQAAALKL